jgi:hypothetical protein
MLDTARDVFKNAYGCLAAIEIGLDGIRRECKRFDHWFGLLAKLDSQSKS